jgi:tetratricopeptide (TPR) repeat protein
MLDDDTQSDAGERPKTGNAGKWLRATTAGCLATPAVLLVAIIGIGIWWYNSGQAAYEQALVEQAAKATEAFAPALTKLETEAEATKKAEVQVDIDKTIRVIHEIDLALQSYDDFEGYLDHVGRQDYRGVAPEVLDARRDLLEKVRELYGKQVEAEQQEALWDMTKGMMLETLSVVDAKGSWGTLGPTGSFNVDHEHAKQLLAEFRENQRAQERRIHEVGQARDELFEVMLQYSETYYGFVEEWDRLCVLRDRAYLASMEGDWKTAEASARAAIELAPTEREAHLLLARAIVEQGNPERYPEAAKLLEDAIADHPGQSAPAFLLLGVIARESGDLEQSRLNFQQAAAYYPKQAGALTDMLDPYKMRSFLRKSRDGTLIIEAYKDTMLGAGTYSPELQLARTAFEQGDFEGGKRRVLDHFSRRRAQQQWDFVLSDLAYAQDLLGTEVRQIFPEDAWLDLQVSQPMWGTGLNVAVNNRTDQTLRNATLILLVQFTDMHPGDYVTFSAATKPAVEANAVTDFGILEVDTDILGKTRGAPDIVRHRAILLTDEAVLWVDTDEYRIAVVDQAVKDRKRAPTTTESDWYQEMSSTLQSLTPDLPEATVIDIEPTLGRDTVVFKLPRELAILRPVFRLTYGGQTWTAQENRIDDDNITLRFTGVDDFTKEDTGDMELGVRTIFGEVALTYGSNGEMSYGFKRMQD